MKNTTNSKLMEIGQKHVNIVFLSVWVWSKFFSFFFFPKSVWVCEVFFFLIENFGCEVIINYRTILYLCKKNCQH